MLTPAAASTLLTFILILASPILAQASNDTQITKPTASTIQLRRTHGTNHTSNAHIVQRDRERIRHQQSRRAGLVGPKTGGSSPSKRNVTRTPRPFDVKAKRVGQTGKEPLIPAYEEGYVFAYYGWISVGTSTPPQRTTVLFDTGSSDVIVPLTDCIQEDSDCSEPCIGPLFDTSRSTTFNPTNTEVFVEFQDGGSADGHAAIDTVTLAGLTVPEQTFVATSKMADFFGPYAGVLGLGFPANGETGANSFFGNLVHSRSLEWNGFSFYISKDSPDRSELCLGCIDDEKYTDQIDYHSVIAFNRDGDPVAWEILCTGISVRSGRRNNSPEPISRWQSEGFEATIDAGTAMIRLSRPVVRALYDNVPFAHPVSRNSRWGRGAYAFPCATVHQMGDVVFKFGANEYVVNWSDLIVGHETNDPTECIGAFIGDRSRDREDNTAIFGLSFMKNVYSVFDYQEKKIGFARLRTIG